MNDREKQILLDKMAEVFEDNNYSFFAWVILSDHYHILFQSKFGKNLSKMMNLIHGGSSYMFNKIDGTKGRKIWQNYFDYCIRNERDFWMHFNYIHHNPVKHGHVNRMGEYHFSSFNMYRKKHGDDWSYSVFEQYPIVDFSIEGD